MQQYSLVYLHDYIVSNEIGEEEIKSILSDFSCPKNQDIEKFLKEKALAFEKIGFARTILVFKRGFCSAFNVSALMLQSHAIAIDTLVSDT